MGTTNRFGAIYLLLALLLATCGCQPVEEKKFTIVCTTTMIADLARNLAGDMADVQGIMRAGEDPHVYEIKPRDANKLADADVVLTNGHHLEATLGQTIENNAEGVVVKLAELAVPHPLASENSAQAPDPHCWMNVENFIGYVEHARDALVQADAKNADRYRANAEKYIGQLRELHQWVLDEIATVPDQRRVMVTSHDAFQYLGHAYNIEVHAMIGISTEQEPRPQDIEKLEALVRQRGVRALFIETSVSATLNNLIKKTAAATGAKIGGTLYSDSLDEVGKPGGTYIEMMRHNVSTIVEALK